VIKFASIETFLISNPDAKPKKTLTILKDIPIKGRLLRTSIILFCQYLMQLPSLISKDIFWKDRAFSQLIEYQRSKASELHG
tara:strand:- start:156 stop:401 length:246 start_codon:yes stop_codon:yes gene_type:complete